LIIVEANLNPASDIGYRWNLLQKKIKETKICSAFDLFRKEGIEPILIKGWASAANYPPDIPRYYNDIDLAVPRHDFDRAENISASENFLALNLDIHKELRHLDTVGWEDLFSNSRLTNIDGTVIRVLRPEDHLRVLCVHWLTDGGANRERLWDIFYAVANRPPDFDWERCIGIVPENRRKWIISVIGITHRYFGLEVDDLPFQIEAKDIPSWMTKCIESEWASGVWLEPVVSHLRSPSSLLQQIRRRIPPNPIRATVEMEGRINARTRVLYQIGTMTKMLTHPFGHATLRMILRRRKK
jgi:hypothetical protein